MCVHKAVFHAKLSIHMTKIDSHSLACTNLMSRKCREKRGFAAPEKTLKKLRPTPLRPKGRFGILLTRCAAQGDSLGRGERSLRDYGASKNAIPRLPQRGAFGRDAEHKGTWKACCDARSRLWRLHETKYSYFSESLILAQNERWQRGLGMQVERDPEGSNVGR